MNKKENFYPKWYEDIPPADSYRSIFKWGDPGKFKHPNEHLYKLMGRIFNLHNEDFKTPQKMGLKRVSYDIPIKLKPEQEFL